MNKKINNKGFTLIELLGVIVVLILILLIAIPSINSTFERKKQKITEQKKEIVLSATDMYANLYKKEFDYAGFINGTCGVLVSTLKEKNLVTEDELKDSEGNIIIKDEDKVKYDNANGKYILDNGIDTVCGAPKP